MPNKEYLGDGVYVEYDGLGLILTSENGVRVLDRIVLDSDTYGFLTEYVQRLVQRNRAAAAAGDQEKGEKKL